MADSRRKSVATEVKVLITTLAVAATVGGWAAMSQANATNVQTVALAQAQTSVLPTTDQSNTTSASSIVNSTANLSSSTTAPAAITFTRSSR